MCQTCIGCGKCTGTTRPGLAAGTCPICGTVGDPDADVCCGCGASLPKRPGIVSKPSTVLSDIGIQEGTPK